MSTTAGAGTVEYIAINPVAVAAALLGMASILVLLHDMLLVIPAAGIVCAIAALRQIRGSGGTQSGILPALVGLVLCLALGGGSVGYKLYQRWNFRNDEQQVAVVLQTLGRDLASASYNQAYALFGEHFRERVPEAPFAATWKEMVIQYNSGPITSIQWNNHALPVEDAPSDRPAVWAMALITFQRGDIIRQPVMLVREEGKWVIEDMPQTFPSTPKQRRSAAP